MVPPESLLAVVGCRDHSSSRFLRLQETLNAVIRSAVFGVEKHLQTEQEQNDAAGHFERVHVNADRVENGAEGFSDIKGKATRGRSE